MPKAADIDLIRRWAVDLPAQQVRLQVLMALEELEVARVAQSDLQVRVMKARVRELVEAKPAKAEELKACFEDIRLKAAEAVGEALALAKAAIDLVPAGPALAMLWERLGQLQGKLS